MVMSVCNGQLARDRLPELWRAIEEAHYVYLDTDDSPDKIRLRKKLEGYITEYLSLVPHECKFALPETGKAFQRTITETDFSAYRAGQGWAALARYAENLLTQPWRKEYRTIRLYCGYYKHEVEANIVGGEALLIAMGYRAAGAGRLVLSEPPCPDTLAGVARDALLANTECNIMCQMWEAAWESGARVSWRDVCSVRASSVGDCTVATKILLRNCRHTTSNRGIYANVPATSTAPPPIRPQRLPTNGTHNNRIYNESPLEEPLPTIQGNYITQPNVIPNIYPVPMYNAIAPQCNQIPMMAPYTPYCYPIPVQNPYMVQAPVYIPVKQATNVPINGYNIPHYRIPAVPTGQLIELENSCDTRLRRDDDRNHKRTTRNVLESSRCTSKSGFSEMSIPSIARSDTQPALSKAREDGMGTYESWDYVFRNLSSKEQERDNRSRISPSLDRDSRTLDRIERDERRFKYQPTTMDLEDGLQALNIDRTYDDDVYRTAKVNENLMRLKQEEELKRSKILAKKHAEEKRLIEEKRRKDSPDLVGHPSSADALIPPKIAPDKLRLLTKQDVKDRKIENSFNGSTTDLKKARKPLKAVEVSADKQSRNKPATNGHHSAGSTSKNITAPQPAQHQAQTSNNYDTKTHLIVTLDETDSIRHSPPRSQSGDQRPSQPAKRDDKWVCTTCTYLNPTDLRVCEMCGKSKLGSDVEPLTSGGRECPICTLVNSKQARVCDACGAKLNDCPTYI